MHEKFIPVTLAVSNLRQYADICYDLLVQMSGSAQRSSERFEAIWIEAEHAYLKNGPYAENERAAFLSYFCRAMLPFIKKTERRLTPQERLMLDAAFGSESRLSQFDSYFLRLSIRERLLLTLRDKIGLQMHEVSTILGKSNGSLQWLRMEAFSSLERWIW